MSHYTTVATKFVDKEQLLLALTDMGWKDSQIEVADDNSLTLIGYDGRERKVKGKTVRGCIRINRKFVQSSANDIGFVKNPDGTFTAMISEFDSYKYNDKWMGGLTQNYATRCTVKQLKKKGFKVKVVKEGGKVQVRGKKA